jgi:hypothetical protein
MGVVYKARQKNPDRIVALKMILAGQLASQADIDRFSAEAHAAATLDHPHIVPIFEVGQHEGQHYFTMGYVAGDSLAQRLLAGPLPAREAATIIAEVALAVEYAHRQRIIHRDLKPANILVDADGRVRVTDFGLAKRQTDESGLTCTGQLLGTPSFMSPEQVSGDPASIGPTSDVYSLGATLYALLTGRPPFHAASTIDTLKQVVDRDPVPPREFDASIPRDLETIVLKCLEKATSARYQSARALADDLQRFLADRPILARRSTTTDRFVRWCRRNPLVASLTATVAAALVLGTTLSTAQAIRATRAERVADTERAEADKQRITAEANYQKARAAVDKYFTLVSETRLLDVPGLQPLRKDLLEAAAHFYKDASQERMADPAMLADLVAAQFRLSQVFLAVNEVDDSLAAVHSALDIVQQLRRDPAGAKYLPKTAGCFSGMRGWEISPKSPRNRLADAQAMYKLEATLSGLADEFPSEPKFQRDLLRVRGLIANWLRDSQKARCIEFARNSLAGGGEARWRISCRA